MGYVVAPIKIEKGRSYNKFIVRKRYGWAEVSRMKHLTGKAI